MGHSVAGDRVLHLHQSKNHKFFPEVFGEAHKEERSGYPDYLCTNDQGGAVVYRELDHCRNRVLYADLLHLSTPYVGDAVHSWNLRLVLYHRHPGSLCTLGTWSERGDFGAGIEPDHARGVCGDYFHCVKALDDGVGTGFDWDCVCGE